MVTLENIGLAEERNENTILLFLNTATNLDKDSLDDRKLGAA